MFKLDFKAGKKLIPPNVAPHNTQLNTLTGMWQTNWLLI